MEVTSKQVHDYLFIRDAQFDWLYGNEAYLFVSSEVTRARTYRVLWEFGNRPTI